MEICKPDKDDNDIQSGVSTDGFPVDVMTGSYGEISFDQEVPMDDASSSDNKNSQSNKDTEKITETKSDVEISEQRRPGSLIFVKNNEIHMEEATKAETLEPLKRVHKSQQTSDSQVTSADGSPSVSSEEFAICSYTHQRTGSDTSGLSDLQGTIMLDGNMVSFYAEDLQEKLKLSSPITKWPDTSSYPGSRSSTPSLQLAVHSQIPLVDENAIADLEIHARKVASCVDTMLENLSETLQSISSLTVEYMVTYESAVCRTCDSVDASIKTMYQLVAKCEELGNSVKPLYKIADDVKNMKRLLDHFEHAVERKS